MHVLSLTTRLYQLISRISPLSALGALHKTRSCDLNIIKGSENQHKLKGAVPSINNDLWAQPKEKKR